MGTAIAVAAEVPMVIRLVNRGEIDVAIFFVFFLFGVHALLFVWHAYEAAKREREPTEIPDEAFDLSSESEEPD